MHKYKVIYRQAKRLDCGQIETINRESLPVYYDRTEWESKVALKLTYVVVVSGQVVGYMSCDPTGCVVSFAIDEKFRGHGYGYNLITYGLRELKNSGQSRIILRVKVGNAPAIQLYQKVGFTIETQLPHYYGIDDHAYLLFKHV